jgi:hypothetical protein
MVPMDWREEMEGERLRFLRVRLSRWPAEVSAGEDMDMEVEDALSALFAGVDDGSVAVVESELCGEFGDHEQEVSSELGVLWGEIIEGDKRFFGDEEDVSGRLGTDIVEGEAEIVFVDDFCGDFAIDDFLEDGHVRVLRGGCAERCLGNRAGPGEISRIPGKLQLERLRAGLRAARGTGGIKRYGAVGRGGGLVVCGVLATRGTRGTKKTGGSGARWRVGGLWGSSHKRHKRHKKDRGQWGEVEGWWFVGF